MNSLDKNSCGFLQTSPLAPFAFADFSLYLFTIINHSHDYDRMLSLVSPLSKSLYLEVALWTPHTASFTSFFQVLNVITLSINYDNE